MVKEEMPVDLRGVKYAFYSHNNNNNNNIYWQKSQKIERATVHQTDQS